MSLESAIGKFTCDRCGTVSEKGLGNGRPVGWAFVEIRRDIEPHEQEVTKSADLCEPCAERLTEVLFFFAIPEYKHQ